MENIACLLSHSTAHERKKQHLRAVFVSDQCAVEKFNPGSLAATSVLADIPIYSPSQKRPGISAKTTERTLPADVDIIRSDGNSSTLYGLDLSDDAVFSEEEHTLF